MRRGRKEGLSAPHGAAPPHPAASGHTHRTGTRPEALIREAATTADMQAARSLFLEYAAWLKVDLCFQGFERELAELPGAYAPPRGRLLLAWADGAAVACAALRPLRKEAGVDIGEIKRLYVCPPQRGRGIARRLAAELIGAARTIGYGALRLDTLEFMHAAAALYRSLGFVDIAPYYDNPLAGTRYMELKLARRDSCQI